MNKLANTNPTIKTLNTTFTNAEPTLMNTSIPSVQPLAEPSRFDPASLRLSQNFMSTTGVKRLTTTIPVRKPNKQDFVRVHTDPAFRLETMVLELKEERETYLVSQDLWPELISELTPKVLFTAINRQKVLFLWPVRLPNEDGRQDNWNASALEAADFAQKDWVKVSANMNLGAYEIYKASGELAEPEWPNIDFMKILEVAFKGQYITDLNHPALRRLRGEV